MSTLKQQRIQWHRVLHRSLSPTLLPYDRHARSHTNLLSFFSQVIVGSVIYCVLPFCFVFICITDCKLFCEIPQDVFPVIPGDTDYRMFAEDYGDIPGLDIIFLRGGYYYHTSFDTVDRILYASFWYI